MLVHPRHFARKICHFFSATRILMNAFEQPATGVLNRYFALLPERECGECMVCCEYMPISTAGLVKPGETLCPHVIVNRGCSIYHTRPNVCRTWHCLWRRDAAMPDELRPDRSRMIFVLVVHEEPRYLFENAHISCIAMKSKDDYRQPAVAAAIQRYVDDGELPVWLGFGGGKTLLHPDTEQADAILNPRTTRHPQLIEQGRQWREHYENMLEDLQIANGRLESQFVKR